MIRDISIGMAGPDFPLNKHPGSTKKYLEFKKILVFYLVINMGGRSFGYKADGKVFTEKNPVKKTKIIYL